MLFRIDKPVSTPRKICVMYQLSAKVKLTKPNIHQAVYLRLSAPNMCKFWNCLYDRTTTQKKGLSKLWGQRPSRLLKTVLTNLCIITRKTPEFVNDLLNCKKWKSTFGSCHNKVDPESIFLSNLAGEYKRCKDKDLSKAVRLWLAKQTQKILIGQTLREVEFLWVGRPQRFSNYALIQLKILAGFEVTLMKREDFCQSSQQITLIQY